MFTNYYLNLVAKNLFNVSGVSTLPSQYQIGLSSTQPSLAGANITEPSESTGYKRICIYNDDDTFAADSLDYDTDFTINNTKINHGLNSLALNVNDENDELSNVTIYGKTNVSTNTSIKNFNHACNLSITIKSTDLRAQRVDFDRNIELKSLNDICDKLVCYSNYCGIEHNIEEIILNGLEYKLHVVNFDSNLNEAFCKIYREYDDTYLTTSSFIIDKDNQTKLNDNNHMLINIQFQTLREAGLGDIDFSIMSVEEFNNYIQRWLQIYPIKVMYVLPNTEYEELDLSTEKKYNTLSINKGNNIIEVQSSINDISFDIEHKLIRPYVFNNRILQFNESITSWNNLNYLILFDQDGQLLYYSKLSKMINVPPRCILSIPIEGLKISCKNQPTVKQMYL